MKKKEIEKLNSLTELIIILYDDNFNKNNDGYLKINNDTITTKLYNNFKLKHYQLSTDKDQIFYFIDGNNLSVIIEWIQNSIDLEQRNLLYIKNNNIYLIKSNELQLINDNFNFEIFNNICLDIYGIDYNLIGGRDILPSYHLALAKNNGYKNFINEY